MAISWVIIMKGRRVRQVWNSTKQKVDPGRHAVELIEVQVAVAIQLIALNHANTCTWKIRNRPVVCTSPLYFPPFLVNFE
jgi:hypothetical protein